MKTSAKIPKCPKLIFLISLTVSILILVVIGIFHHEMGIVLNQCLGGVFGLSLGVVVILGIYIGGALRRINSYFL